MKNVFSIGIREIPQQGLGLTTSWESKQLDAVLGAGAELAILSPLILRIKLLLAGNKILLNGSFKVALELDCARCLKLFSVKIAGDFRYVFWPQQEQSLNEEQELRQDDLEVVYFAGDHIDLPSLVKEQVCMHVPDYPRCREDCRGLCPRCGVDLNMRPCSCTENDAASRSPFGLLKQLKKM
ncbi:MAG: DUF177 domain-containing protein [Deltaproteobacteria bacterium]|nr:DUF177 domain-containing protein [Deltaproteobacteria bacterium]